MKLYIVELHSTIFVFIISNILLLHALSIFLPPDQSFRDFTRTALIKHRGQLKCSASGQPLKSHSPNGGNGFDGEYGKGDEESIRDAKNCELLGSCAPLTAGAYSINTKTTELFLLLSSFFLFFQL